MESSASGELKRLLTVHTGSLARAFFLACAYNFGEIVGQTLHHPELELAQKEQGLNLALLHGEHEVCTQLIRSGNDLKITEAMLISYLESRSTDLSKLLDHCGHIPITSSVLLSARQTDADTMKLLLDRLHLL